MKGQTVYLKTYPFQSAVIIKRAYEKKGRHIRYWMPKYRVRFYYDAEYTGGTRAWFGEYQLDETPDIFGNDNDDDD